MKTLTVCVTVCFVAACLYGITLLMTEDNNEIIDNTLTEVEAQVPRPERPTPTETETPPAQPIQTPLIQTHRLELIDEAGQTRGVFFATANGDAGIEFRDAAGNSRVQIGTLKGETIIRLYGTDQRPDIVLRTENGDGKIELMDKAQRTVFQIFLRNGEPAVQMFDIKGVSRIFFALLDGDPKLECFGPNSKKPLWRAP